MNVEVRTRSAGDGQLNGESTTKNLERYRATKVVLLSLTLTEYVVPG